MAEPLVRHRSPRLQARFAGVFYVLNTFTSLYAFFGPPGRLSFYSGLVASAAYIAVTVLFFFLFKPVNLGLSLLAALFSTIGTTVGVLNSLHLMSIRTNVLVFFGFYCVLIGYLIYRSTFLPHLVGVLMVFAGFGYLTLLWPALGNSLAPWNYIPGAIGEWTLTVWLLVRGVNEQRWLEQASSCS